MGEDYCGEGKGSRVIEVTALKMDVEHCIGEIQDCSNS